jgi:cellulose synthase/poly-beta-1,6-N-acetylglucosamine synthase-like glycosyltransferase
LVITTRDRRAMLAEALASTRTLDHGRFDLEVIVVDDGSSDDTPEFDSHNGSRNGQRPKHGVSSSVRRFCDVAR